MEIANLELKVKFMGCLNERQRRYFAAILAADLGIGGKAAVGRSLKIHPDTIRRGGLELSSAEPFDYEMIRKKGGGRKKKWGSCPKSELRAGGQLP